MFFHISRLQSSNRSVVQGKQYKVQQTVEAVYCGQGEFSVTEVNESVIAYFLDTLNDGHV